MKNQTEIKRTLSYLATILYLSAICILILIFLTFSELRISAAEYGDLLSAAQGIVKKMKDGGDVRFTQEKIKKLNIYKELDLEEHFFKPGDSWDLSVAYRKIDSLHPEGQLERDHEKARVYSEPSKYRFHVEEADKNSALIRISSASEGQPNVGKVRAMQIRLDRQYQILEKNYIFSTQVEPIRSEEKGNLGAGSGMDPYPIILPPLWALHTLFSVTKTKFNPIYPKEMQKDVQIAKQRRMPQIALALESMELNTYQFEIEDFLGRKIQILWRVGELWPSFIRTSNAILWVSQWLNTSQ